MYTTIINQHVLLKNNSNSEVRYNIFTCTKFHHSTCANAYTCPIPVCLLGCAVYVKWCTAQSRDIHLYMPLMCTGKWQRFRMLLLQWLIHTAPQRDRYRDREREKDQWVLISWRNVQVPDRDKDQDPLFPIVLILFPAPVPFPVPCSVTRP